MLEKKCNNLLNGGFKCSINNEDLNVFKQKYNLQNSDIETFGDRKKIDFSQNGKVVATAIKQNGQIRLFSNKDFNF